MKKKVLTGKRKLKLLEKWANAIEATPNDRCLKISKNSYGEWEIWESCPGGYITTTVACGPTRDEAIERAFKHVIWLKSLIDDSYIGKTYSWSQVEMELAVRGIEV